MKHVTAVARYNKLDLISFKQELCSDVAPNYTYDSIVYQVDLKTTNDMSKAELEACFELIAHTSKSDYEQSSIGWKPRSKKAEMRDVDMRYLLVRSEVDLELLGFASFMLTMDNNQEIVYLYEIHLSDTLRGKGLGKHLIEMVSTIGKNAEVTKIMLTVFVQNRRAAEWYNRLGFTVDESSPEARTLRNGVVKEADYRILSRQIA